MDSQQLRNILESCLLVAGSALSMKQLEALFVDDIDRPDKARIRQALEELQQQYEGRGIELVKVASGWRLQSCSSMTHWVAKLTPEKPPRYSRALLETLVLIAYRQPLTRGEIEDIRGVAVSSNIMRTLQERGWIREVGQKDVPGRPSLWGTTREFLDYFNLQRLEDLPTLAEARDLSEIEATLEAELGPVDPVEEADAVSEADTVSRDGAGDDSGSPGSEIPEPGIAADHKTAADHRTNELAAMAASLPGAAGAVADSPTRADDQKDIGSTAPGTDSPPEVDDGTTSQARLIVNNGDP